MYWARLTDEKLRLPGSTLGVLQRLQLHYMESISNSLPLSVRRERAEAWLADARTAAAHHGTGDYAHLIHEQLRQAEYYAHLEGGNDPELNAKEE